MRFFHAAAALVLTLSNLTAAPIVTITISGVVATNTLSVRENSYLGDPSGLPADFYLPTAGTTTPIPVGTPFTAEFVYDVAAMPAAIQSNATGIDGGVPITTHTQTSSSIQWLSSRLQVAGFTFSTAAEPGDTPPAEPSSSTLSNTDRTSPMGRLRRFPRMTQSSPPAEWTAGTSRRMF